MNKAISQNTKLNLREAERYLPDASKSAHLRFAERQYRSRIRFTLLKYFYTQNHCRMARLHLLATCAVTLGRFAGFSRTFDEMGEHFLSVNYNNQTRTLEWQQFVEACDENLPIEIRDELWLAAHFKDSNQVLADERLVYILFADLFVAFEYC
ncbi:MAG: hypothetical protein M3405_01400 [Acidobacteriota bacterium]|jgi:hypothetical protein|nr:hypothetical protein [Acidobacteriota bacterium]